MDQIYPVTDYMSFNRYVLAHMEKYHYLSKYNNEISIKLTSSRDIYINKIPWNLLHSSKVQDYGICVCIELTKT